MRLSAHHLKAAERADVVYRKAEELHITPEEVFARAFMEAGYPRSRSIAPFSAYCKGDGTDRIPQVVIDFCGKPPPHCANPACPTKSLGRFSRMDANGRPTYFCSTTCMDATPKAESKMGGSEMTSTEGLKILERVKTAMSNAEYARIPPELIRPMKGQPRIYFNPERQSKLVDSLKEVGQMTPGICRRIPKDENGCEYELCDGERRWRGVIEADLSEYRTMIIDIDDEAAPYVVSVISNFNREEHTVLELTDAVVKMHEGLKLTMYQIGRTLGISYPEASKLYGLRRLIPEVRDMLDPTLMKKRQQLPKLAAIQISQEPPERQLALAKKKMGGQLTVSGLKEHIRHEAAGRGEVVPRRALHPEDRRRSFKSRLNLVSRYVNDLGALLDEDETLKAISEFPPQYLQELNTGLKTSLDRLKNALLRVEVARKNSK